MRRNIKKSFQAVSFCCLLFCSLICVSNKAQAQDQSQIIGKITSFDCGDNCYLTIDIGNGKELSGLCVASTCKPWNDKAEIPKDLIGRSVDVRLSKGQQLDASGNVRGSTAAFAIVKLLSGNNNSEIKPEFANSSIWKHNGSTVRLDASGNGRKFFYIEPRAGLAAKPDDLLFEGQLQGKSFSGTAYLFSKSCGRASYSVSGMISPDEKTIQMVGNAPRRDSNCQIIGTIQDKLLFSFVSANPVEASLLAQRGDMSYSNTQSKNTDILFTRALALGGTLKISEEISYFQMIEELILAGFIQIKPTLEDDPSYDIEKSLTFLGGDIAKIKMQTSKGVGVELIFKNNQQIEELRAFAEKNGCSYNFNRLVFDSKLPQHSMICSEQTYADSAGKNKKLSILNNVRKMKDGVDFALACSNEKNEKIVIYSQSKKVVAAYLGSGEFPLRLEKEDAQFYNYSVSYFSDYPISWSNTIYSFWINRQTLNLFIGNYHMMPKFKDGKRVEDERVEFGNFYRCSKYEEPMHALDIIVSNRLVYFERKQKAEEEKQREIDELRRRQKI